MMKEKIICCLLVAMIIISCVACGSSTNTTTQESDATTSQEDSNASADSGSTEADESSSADDTVSSEETSNQEEPNLEESASDEEAPAEDESAPEEDDTPSEEDLTLAVSYIKEAEDLISSIAASQLNHWSKYSSVMAYYFDDEEYMNANETTIAARAEQIHEDRTAADEKMSEAKSLIGTSGTGDYYDAVKDYYLLVKDYWSLVSTFPEGYSKLTFSATVGDFNSNCQSAYNELEFYVE